MLKNFRTYQLVKEFYQSCAKIKAPRHLRDQLLRASSSIVLNLAEGSGKHTPKEQKRYYFIAMGSLRECQSILELLCLESSKPAAQADNIGACLWNLCRTKLTP